MHLQRVGKVKPSQCTAELLPGLKLWNYLPVGKGEGKGKAVGQEVVNLTHQPASHNYHQVQINGEMTK